MTVTPNGQGWQPRPLPTDRRARSRTVELLAHAFRDDPAAIYTEPDPARRLTMNRRFFSALLDAPPDVYTVRVVGDPIVAAALWAPPLRIDARDDAWDIATSLRKLERGQLERLGEAIEALEAVHARVFAGPYWFLQFVGTDPVARGSGAASALIDARTSGLPDPQIPRGLQAFGERLRGFYELRGWETLDTANVTFAGVPLFSMRRP